MTAAAAPLKTDDETAEFPAPLEDPRPLLRAKFAAARDVVVRDVDEFRRFRGVIGNLVAQELQVRYQRSMLGFLWTLVNPALMMGTQALVFSRLFRGIGGMGPWEYAVFLFAGAMPWTFLATSLTECTTALIHQEGLIRKIYVPKWIFPLARVLIQGITFALSLTALFLMLWPLGAPVSSSLLALPIAMVMLGAFTMGLGLIAATIHTFFRDFGHFLGVGLQAWYFLTPIIYRADFLPANERWKFWLNPAYPFVRLFQIIIHESRWPSVWLFLLCACIGVSTLVLGYVVFKSQERKIVFRL
jgi:ABC-2 type transport system permease protein/lipopolysaccharide transport system permease protein